MGSLTSLAEAAALIYGFDSGIQDVKDAGSDGLALSRTLGNEAATRSRFKPFAISSAGGSGNVSSDNGVTNLELSPQSQAMQDQLRTTASGLFQSAGAGTGAAEQANFDKIEALLNPTRKRDRLLLEERLFAQGRSGVTTSAYGGTPEGLAMEKAIEESKNDSAVRAIDLARQGQTQDFNIGSGMFNASMTPENQLFKLLQGGTGIADLQNTADRTGATLFGGLAETGLETKIGAEAVAGNLQQQQIEGLTKLLAGGGTGADSTPGLINQVLGLFGFGDAPAAP